MIRGSGYPTGSSEPSHRHGSLSGADDSGALLGYGRADVSQGSSDEPASGVALIDTNTHQMTWQVEGLIPIALTPETVLAAPTGSAAELAPYYTTIIGLDRQSGAQIWSTYIPTAKLLTWGGGHAAFEGLNTHLVSIVDLATGGVETLPVDGDYPSNECISEGGGELLACTTSARNQPRAVQTWKADESASQTSGAIEGITWPTTTIGELTLVTNNAYPAQSTAGERPFTFAVDRTGARVSALLPGAVLDINDQFALSRQAHDCTLGDQPFYCVHLVAYQVTNSP